MSYQTWKSYTKIIPNTAEEREIARRQDAEEEADYIEVQAAFEAMALLTWTASSGQVIRVHQGWYDGEFAVYVDEKEHGRCIIEPASARWQAAGIVAKLGPVGLTAERKAVLEASK